MAGQPLEEAFDLCIIDDPNLNRFKDELEARRDAEQPGILPVLLVTHRPDIWARVPNLWQLVDEAIMTPVAKMELQSRVEILLRARRISLDLKLRNEDLEAFIQAMSHDLRASVRAVTMFAEAVTMSEQRRLSEEGNRTRANSLGRPGNAGIDRFAAELFTSWPRRSAIRTIDLREYIESCLRNLQG